ncbi:MAG: hypothetical protein JSR54_02780 [Proteobacteria bacterium]|nr:hypothetical protein [Pseudomonadota bacterium]
MHRPACCLAAALLALPVLARAQAGPPFLTNDPGTPGHGNWEINLAAQVDGVAAARLVQLPQVDANLGIGDRIQLTLEMPYVLRSGDGATRGAWGNANPGIKWRFLDEGEDGWRASLFPQYETGASRVALTRGIADDGHRWLLPVEVARTLGPLELDVEVGCYCVGRGPREQVAGVLANRPVSARLEFAAEVYHDRVAGQGAGATTLNAGGRYKFTPALIGLFMAGHRIGGGPPDAPDYVAYVGIQVLLSGFGRTLGSAGP